MRTPFIDWLLQQMKRDDPIGDVARDAAADKDFPRGDVDDITGYMAARGCEGAQRALQRAIREWRSTR